MKKIKVFVATPTTGSVVDSQQYALRDLQETYKEHIELVYPRYGVRRIFHDHARNKLVEEFLLSNADVLWFLDSDITPPQHLFDLLVMPDYKDWKVAGASYPVFMVPGGGSSCEVVYTVYQENPVTGNLAPGNVPSYGRKYVEGLATGCLFIKREVFSQLKKPYFEFKYSEDIRDIVEGEDLGFCRKMKELGIKFFTDFSMLCKHSKNNIDLLDVNNYAITYSNRSIEAYQRMISEGLKARVKAQKDLQNAPKSKIWVPK